jgi:hypothetical protein
MDGFEHAYRAYASVGKWIARTWALLAAWAVTYALLFAALFQLGNHWLLYLSPAPIIVHSVLEPWFIKREAKTFGKAE